MGNKKTTVKNNETATTKPELPGYALPAVTNYYSQLGNLDVTQPFTAPRNALQNTAYNNAINLGSADDYNYVKGTINDATRDLRGLGTAQTTLADLPASYAPTRAEMPSAYSAAKVGNVAGPGLALANGADLGGLESLRAGRVDVGPAVGAQAGSVLENLQAYYNPATEKLVDTTMAQWNDQAGRARADYLRRGAAAGAFGGSDFAIGEAELGGNLARQGALTAAELYNNAWNSATGLSAGDADRRTQASIASAAEANRMAALQAQLSQEANLFDAMTQREGGLEKFRAANQVGMFNADNANDAFQAIYGNQMQNARQDASAQNDVLSQIYGTTAQNNQFNAGQANDVLSQIYGTTAQNNQFNAGQSNDMAQFNQQQQLAALQAQLQAAGMLGDVVGDEANGQRADTALQGTLGDNLWSQQNADTLAARLAMLGDLLNPQLIGLGTGQTINTTGTQTSKQSGGLLGDILGGAFGLGAAALGR